MHILLVDDDERLAKRLASFLEEQGYTTTAIHRAQEIDNTLLNIHPDLILLDIHLPDGNGLEICHRLRQTLTIPIIMLTGSEEDIDKILALERGATNFLNKPINPRVLLAFIQTTLKNKKALTTETHIAPAHEIWCFSGWELHTSTRILHKPDQSTIALHAAEYNLLLALIKHPQRILTRNQLLDFLSQERDIFERTIDALVSRVRKKVELNPKEPQIIKTVRGGGYLFDSPVTCKTVNAE